MLPLSLCWKPTEDAQQARGDALLVALAALHGAVLAAGIRAGWPGIPLIAAGLWWNSNTIAHNFIHRRFFRTGRANALFSLYLSLLLGIPQTLWRDRHLAHHAGVPPRLRVSRQVVIETVLVIGWWAVLGMLNPRFFFSAYMPGYVIGLALCALQGHYEHARGVTSHYGTIYNFLCFNDGYHAEHHAHPGLHWTALPARVEVSPRTSGWPALLRFMDAFTLEGLERLAIRWPAMRRFVLRSHRRAFSRMQLPAVERVTIVGGGLFPRTALLLRERMPGARLTIIDASRCHLEIARLFLDSAVDFSHHRYVPGQSCECDLLVIPLSFEGDRQAIYRNPPAPAVLVHDWIWRPRGNSRIVSVWLLKRVNLIARELIAGERIA